MGGNVQTNSELKAERDSSSWGGAVVVRSASNATEATYGKYMR